MAGKIITTQQQAHVAGLLTGLCAALDKKGFAWNRQHRSDIGKAFGILGVPCPFKFEDARPGTPPTRWQRFKAAVGVKP